MRKALTNQTIEQNTYKTVHRGLTWQIVKKTHTNQCARHLRDKKSTEHIKTSVRYPNVTNRQQNTYKTLCEALTWWTLQQKTFKTVRKTLTWQKIIKNTAKTVRQTLTNETIKPNTYKTEREALTWRTVNKTHKCPRNWRHKLSRKLIPNSARDTNVKKVNRTHKKQCARH